MSQVDDWSDGYTSDYLRNLNTYGPASANVPRPSSVVSHQVQYQPPAAQTGVQTEAKTNDTPLYDNDGGFNPGPQRLVSAPPRSFRGNATAAQRAARPKPAVKKNTQSASKQQTQSASKQQPQPEYRTGGARTPEENEITRSAAEHRVDADLGQLNSQALDAAARFLPALKLLGFGAGAGSASVPETNFNHGLMGGVGRQVESMRATDSEQPAQSVLAGPDESVKFANLPPEVLRDIAERKGRSFAGNLFNDIPWWAFALGGPSNAGMNKAFDFARSKFADAVNSTMRYGSARGAPTESFSQPAASASASWRTGRTAEYPAGTGKLDQFGGWGESGRSAVGTGSAPASDGAAKLGEQTVSYKDSVARLADAGTETAGREAAGADATAGAAARQGAGEAAGADATAGAAARQGAGEAAEALAPQLQKDLLAVRQKVSSEGDSFERIRDVLRTSAGRQELLPANIREACEPLRRIMEQGGGAALTPAEREAAQLYISKSVTPGAAGAAGANGAAGTAARQGEGKAAGTLSNYDRQEYNNYIKVIQSDPDYVDLISPTLNRVVGTTGRSIDSLSDAELYKFYLALNDVVNARLRTYLSSLG